MTEAKNLPSPSPVHFRTDQLGISPQCGFSSTVLGNKLTIDDQVAKLKLIVQVAREVWGA